MHLSIFPYTVLQKLFARILWRLSGERDIPANESHAANQDILHYLQSHSEPRSKWAPNYFDKPYEMQADVYLFEKLYEMGKGLPQYSFGVAYGYPVLVYAKGGVVFAVAKNGAVIALRLPPQVRSEALASGLATDVLHIPGGRGYPEATIPASELGEDWLFTSIWGQDDTLVNQWLRAAYDYAEKLA